MAEITFAPIRDYSKDKPPRLLAAGFQWPEKNRNVAVYKTALILITYFMLGIAIFLLISRSLGPGFIMLVAGAGAAFFTYRLSATRSYRRRTIIFESSGRIAAPGGLPFLDNQTEVRGHYHDVQVIEPRPNALAGGYDVNLYSARGKTVVLALGLDQNSAHEVSVGLNTALKEIHRANPRPQGAPPRPAR